MLSEHHEKYDVFRGFAAIAVLFDHVVEVFLTRLLGPENWLVLLAATIARHAVLVFFLLSGYLITLSIIFNVKRNGRFDTIEYLSARIARIYPPLCGAIVIALGAWLVIHLFHLPGDSPYGLATDKFKVREYFSVSGRDVVLALLMQDGLLQSDGPLWSLYIEFHIYLLAMTVAIAWTARSIVKKSVWLALGLSLLLVLTQAKLSFVFFCSVWVLGAIIALAANFGRLYLLSKAFIASAVISVLVLMWLGFDSLKLLLSDYPPAWRAYLVQLLFCFCYAYLMFFSRLFHRPMPIGLTATGNYSYTLYVIHFPLLLLIYSFSQNWMSDELGRTLLIALVAALSVVLIASAMAHFLEDQRRFKPGILVLTGCFRTWFLRVA